MLAETGSFFSKSPRFLGHWCFFFFFFYENYSPNKKLKHSRIISRIRARRFSFSWKFLNFPPIYIIKRIYVYRFLTLLFSLSLFLPILLIRTNDINKLLWKETLWYNIHFNFTCQKIYFLLNIIKYHKKKKLVSKIFHLYSFRNLYIRVLLVIYYEIVGKYFTRYDSFVNCYITKFQFFPIAGKTTNDRWPPRSTKLQTYSPGRATNHPAVKGE